MPRSLNAIRSLRLAKSPPWSQRDLARRTGASPKNISRYELGKSVPELSTALALANALGRRVEEVFFELFEDACARVGARSASR